MSASVLARPLAAHLRAKLRMALHGAAGVRDQSKLKVAVIAVFAVVLWIVAFIAFYEGFSWLQSFGTAVGEGMLSIGEIVTLRILSIFTLALFLLLIFSNLLIAFSTFYRSDESAFLLSTPAPVRQVFLGRFVECLIFSSWASAYLGSPLILAYGLTSDAPPMFYLAALLYYPPFVTIPAAIGAFVTMGAVRVYPHVPKSALLLAAAAALVLLAAYLRTLFMQAAAAEEGLLTQSGFAAFKSFTSRTQSPFLPSQWTARGLILAAERELDNVVFYFFLLLSNALMAVLIAAEAAARWLYPGWTTLASRGDAGRRGRFRPLNLADRLLERLPQPWQSMAAKDIKLFWRDPTQWLQFLVFFGIMAVYLVGLRQREGSGIPYYQGWVVSMNIGACTLILATLTSRFVFPLISLEGRRFWLLGIAPITVKQIIWQKWALSVATSSLFTIPLIVLSCIRLGVETPVFLLAIYSIIAANFGLSGLAVGLGALYPSFHEENPARVVSGMGGTLNFLLSMGYIALIIAAETLVIQWEALELITGEGRFEIALAAVAVFVGCVSAVCTWLPMKLGLANLRAAEF